MRLNEVTGYTIEEILAELDRRGFLKGLGAAAALAAFGKPSDALAKGLTFQDIVSELKEYGIKKFGKGTEGSYNYVHIDSPYGTGDTVFGWVSWKIPQGKVLGLAPSFKSSGVHGFRYHIKERKLSVSDPRLQMMIDLAKQGYRKSDTKIADGKF